MLNLNFLWLIYFWMTVLVQRINMNDWNLNVMICSRYARVLYKEIPHSNLVYVAYHVLSTSLLMLCFLFLGLSNWFIWPACASYWVNYKCWWYWSHSYRWCLWPYTGLYGCEWRWTINRFWWYHWRKWWLVFLGS